MSCYTYNCADQLGDHTLNDCEAELQGGFKNIIILECGHQVTDASDGTEINAEIAAGRATLIKNVKVGVPAASATKIASNIANTPDKTVKYTTELTLMDGNVNASNMTFYNTLASGTSFGGLIIHNADEGIVLWYNETTRGEGSLISPDNNGEFMRYEFRLTFDSQNNEVMPTYATEPSGVF